MNETVLIDLVGDNSLGGKKKKKQEENSWTKSEKSKEKTQEQKEGNEIA